jgi:hypothetical protein
MSPNPIIQTEAHELKDGSVRLYTEQRHTTCNTEADHPENDNQSKGIEPICQRRIDFQRLMITVL